MSQRGKWSEEETAKLLKLIAASPTIYNPYDARYHDRFLKDTIWSSIGYKIKKPVDMCKKQWWYLRGSRKLDFLENMEYNKKTYKYTSRKRVSKISVVDTDESNSTVKKTSRVADSNKPNNTVDKTSRLVNTGKSNRIVKKTSQIEVPLSIIKQTPKKNRPAGHQNKEETQNKISKPQEKEDIMTTSFISYVTKTLSTLPPFLRVKARNEMLTVLTKFKLIAEGRDPRDILSIQPKNSQNSLSNLAELIASNMSNNLQNCLSKDIVDSQESLPEEAEEEQYTSSQSAMYDSIPKEGKQSHEIDADESPEESKLSVSKIRIKSEDLNVPDLKTKTRLKEFEEYKMTTNTGLTNEILTKIKIKPEKREITVKLEPGLSTEPGMSIEPGLSNEPETKLKIEPEEQVIKSEEGEMYIKSEPIDFPISIEENIY